MCAFEKLRYVISAVKVQKRLEILRFQAFWAGTDKIDILVEKNAARRAAYQLRAQRSTRKGHAASVKLHRLAAMSLTAARRVAVGKEEQRRERALTFKKVGASDTQLAPTWSE